jgi:hypothetical protein
MSNNLERIRNEEIMKYFPLRFFRLRHYAASRKVAGSSPYEVDFLNRPKPSGRTMALGSTQPLTEISTRNL